MPATTRAPAAQELAPNLKSANGSKPATSNVVAPTDDQIRLRAFQIWQARSGKPGSAQQDWEQAKRELSAGIQLKA